MAWQAPDQSAVAPDVFGVYEKLGGELPRDKVANTEVLNLVGQQGWELVAVTHQPGPEMTYFDSGGRRVIPARSQAEDARRLAPFRRFERPSTARGSRGLVRFRRRHPARGWMKQAAGSQGSPSFFARGTENHLPSVRRDVRADVQALIGWRGGSRGRSPRLLRRNKAATATGIVAARDGSGTTEASDAQSVAVGPPTAAVMPKFAASTLKSMRFVVPSRLKSPVCQVRPASPKFAASTLKSAKFTAPSRLASPPLATRAVR